MNEFVFVEFLFDTNSAMQGASEVIALGEDFILIKSEIEWEDDTQSGHSQGYQRIRGKINSATATAIKLGNPFLSDRMRISYISNELKDKYRNR
jgi:hypothetical protein